MYSIVPKEKRNYEPTIFVGGPIQYAIEDQGFDCSLRSQIDLIISHLQEFKYKVLSAHITENFGEETHSLSSETITKRDFAWMQACDLFIAVLPENGEGKLYRSDGTHIELGWATVLNKTTIILTHPHCIPELSHLVRGLNQLLPVTIVNIESALTEKSFFQLTIEQRLQNLTTKANSIKNHISPIQK
ncbi:MAG: nucleoside 2-deoxyribosyltransferase [Microcystis sp. M54BS1]|jgi:nucleoside 2-deoxyribosyltransferase|uniref:nucleoside 2-deoxyribosyltransferase n=1 Tax=unclassified Microcystis TaxID=2643300 RepID=UPI002580D047|nr:MULTISPECIES: nucleoside 2-deoxyribosyltransferase [unclassified Microcystis]MCA2538916.1 nucleoside 2-deoxyribosyltransferase [Microcystis sp. M54BS1]MCA2596560.1 nucleoside 2-deoxyribosyltransferase [Microcystis sp. M38BS1]MCA2611963.1 nucleoside 2-deoxyribosyltransferase [Microcystis sp. M27BS1]NCR76456.1 hypothetical protein [Microcystis aeruginosa K13-06]MCA2504791.1 nucleoside 2-deoxyribosyltransferase [Microcystis sp. M62BS1]